MCTQEAYKPWGTLKGPDWCYHLSLDLLHHYCLVPHPRQVHARPCRDARLQLRNRLAKVMHIDQSGHMRWAIARNCCLHASPLIIAVCSCQLAHITATVHSVLFAVVKDALSRQEDALVRIPGKRVKVCKFYGH
jgi:hypothetical protein